MAISYKLSSMRKLWNLRVPAFFGAVLGILLGTGYGSAQQGVAAVGSRSFPEIHKAFERERLHVEELADQGRNLEAIKLAKSMFDRMPLDPDDQALLLADLSRFCTEIGLIAKASNFIKAAENTLVIAEDRYPIAFYRQKAALSYTLGAYNDAVKAAAKAYHPGARGTLRGEYSHGIQALSLLRMGNLQEAEKAVLNAVKAAPKHLERYPVYGPRILYSACVVESHAGKGADAEAFCRRGLEIAVHLKHQTRDLSLGYLALAEAQLLAGDLAHGYESAQKAADLTTKLFGTQHQDLVEALDLLALISLKEGDAAAARAHVAEAIKIATALFGEGSHGANIPARVLREIDEQR